MDVNLVLLLKNGSTKSFVLPSTVTSLGRRQDCDFCLPIGSISRKHCEINLDQNMVTIRDFGSQNGTFLNGQRIEEARAKAGDLLQIGPVKFVIQIDGQPASFESYQPQSEAPAKKSESPTGRLDEFSLDNVNNSATTDMLDSLPDDFDIEADIENELRKQN